MGHLKKEQFKALIEAISSQQAAKNLRLVADC
jgi:hypothetical protein